MRLLLPLITVAFGAGMLLGTDFLTLESPACSSASARRAARRC